MGQNSRIEIAGGDPLVLEILVVVTIAGILTAMAIGITPSVVRSMKGDSVAQQPRVEARQRRRVW